jgi:hypothetical protein|tara:strand:- start:1620 stop:2333 length:714 start_codon:yes stop_codon:yes gene_type:complete
MNRLITFGCSYTHGIGLDGLDFHAHKYYDSPLESVLKIQSASPDAWPHLLANHLGLECINLGRGSSSPKYIFQMIREFEFQKTDIVVVQWPDPSRHVIWGAVSGWSDTDLTIDMELIVSHDSPYSAVFYEKYYTEFNSLYDNAVLIESTHAYLKDKCDQVHSVSDNIATDLATSQNMTDWFRNQSLKILLKTFPILSEVKKFFNGYNFDDHCNDLHPGKSYHVAFADAMTEQIKDYK